MTVHTRNQSASVLAQVDIRPLCVRLPGGYLFQSMSIRREVDKCQQSPHLVLHKVAKEELKQIKSLTPDKVLPLASTADEQITLQI